MAERIQLRRTGGWRKPVGAVVVARPSKWGNPFVVHKHTAGCYDDGSATWKRCPGGDARETREAAVRAFRFLYDYPCSGDPRVPDVDEVRAELAGRDLACWCPLDQPCHADVLLGLANGGAA